MTRLAFIFGPLCIALLLASGCGDDDEDNSTHEVVDATIEGVCSKLDSLQCAQPNCDEKLELFSKNCNPDVFQDLLDCLSVASFKCDGDPEIPRTHECEAQLDADCS